MPQRELTGRDVRVALGAGDDPVLVRVRAIEKRGSSRGARFGRVPRRRPSFRPRGIHLISGDLAVMIGIEMLEQMRGAGRGTLGGSLLELRLKRGDLIF